VPSEGGTAEQVTTEGGTAPRISADGRTLYYRRSTLILARPLAGGAERTIATNVFGISNAYLPFGNELFHVILPDPSRPGQVELRATDVITSKTRSIGRFEATIVNGLAVSPDGKTLLLAILRSGADLRLVENFE
jgi:Tol biopolymer transport system component